MQSMIPLISSVDGKIIMEEPHRISIGPNGNGALFDAISRNPEVKGVIEQVEYVQVIGVDNVLNRLLDPIYVGFAQKKGLQAAMKSCVKRDAKELVGVVVKKVKGASSHYDIVEYSEISEADASAVDPTTGELRLNLGNILVFLFKTDMLLNLCKNTETLNSLYHKALKKVPFWDFT
jgi:UDP-N-acetylglucosamine/UDP-N-acetylgalactosamine diphosphorylase